jgi:hypothetical protein
MRRHDIGVDCAREGAASSDRTFQDVVSAKGDARMEEVKSEYD